jgi:hypothetical protein
MRKMCDPSRNVSDTKILNSLYNEIVPGFPLEFKVLMFGVICLLMKKEVC